MPVSRKRKNAKSLTQVIKYPDTIKVGKKGQEIIKPHPKAGTHKVITHKPLRVY